MADGSWVVPELTLEEKFAAKASGQFVRENGARNLEALAVEVERMALVIACQKSVLNKAARYIKELELREVLSEAGPSSVIPDPNRAESAPV